MNDAVPFGIVGQQGVLLVLLLADGLLGFGLLVAVLLRELVVLLLVLRLLDGGEASLLAFQLGEDGLQSLCGIALGVGQHTLYQLVVGIQHDAIHVGHLCIEAHTALIAAHVLHTAHVFALRDQHGLCLLAQRLHLNRELRLLHLWHLRLEDL